MRPDGDGIQEIVGDKGYHSNQSLVDLEAVGVRSYISEPDRERRNLLPMTVSGAGLTASDSPCGKEAWNKFVPDLVAAQSAFVRGDPASMKALWSHAEDVTLMGPGEAASVGGR